MRSSYLIVAFALLLTACYSGTDSLFKNPSFRAIAEFQDRGKTDSLIRFLRSPNQNYRAAAAFALASVCDTTAARELGNVLLEDHDTLVRVRAAFALGQTGGIESVNALIAALKDDVPRVASEVLQALGKTITKRDFHVLVDYKPTDSITEEGYAWSLYRLGSRGFADSSFTERELEFLKMRYTERTRIGAANYFSRSPVKGSRFEKALIQTVSLDPSAEVRLAATNGLKKLRSSSAFAALEKILRSEKDYKIKVNAVRALANYDPATARPLLLLMLHDSTANVCIATSEIIATSIKAPWPEILEAARNSPNWRVQANLYKAILTINPTAPIITEVRQLITRSNNNYQKAALLGALAKDPAQFSFISNELLKSKVPVIKSSAADALSSVNRAPDFPMKLRPQLAAIYRAWILDGDPAVISIVCDVLSDSLLGYREQYKNITFLNEAKSKLQMPADGDAIHSLEQAIAWLSNTGKVGKKTPVWNHPIDWDQVAYAGEHSYVEVITNKGKIAMRLLVNDAPGSVANFGALCKAKYFDNKFFHRTVPNFVIQTGSERGDGSGNEGYSIRSEFSKRTYTRGAVGMASAGKNTEGTQWFITNSATPHLDGRYTLFAIVTSGMDVVDKIEVGDKIVSVSMNTTNPSR